MRVEITNGKIKGWLTTAEAAFVLDISTSAIRKMIADGTFKQGEKFELYGRYFVKGSVVDKLKKKAEKAKK